MREDGSDAREETGLSDEDDGVGLTEPLPEMLHPASRSTANEAAANRLTISICLPSQSLLCALLGEVMRGRS